MTLEGFHDFYVASAGVAGGLIGLLFVAISVAHERDDTPDVAALHDVRASAAFTAFSNALVVSLCGLIPGGGIGTVTITVSIIGLLFVARSVLVLNRFSRQTLRRHPRDAFFVVFMAAWFIGQLLNGIRVDVHPHSSAGLQWASYFVIVFFVAGIARAWELIGGPQYTLTDEARRLITDVRAEDVTDD